MKKFISIFAIIIIVSLIVGLLGFFTEGFKDWTFSDKLPDKEITEQDGQLEIVPETNETNELITLAIDKYNGPFMASPEGLTAIDTRIVTATITPAEATNKNVDWSVAWVTPDDGFAVGKIVTEFVNVYSDYDGSLTAIVECYKAFENEIIHIICTTRDGNFTAMATVSFSGRPKDVYIENTLSYVPATESLAGYYEVTPNSTYSFPIILDNNYGSVNPSFYDGIGVDVVGLGKIYLEDYSNSPGATTHWIGNGNTVELNTMTNKFIDVSYVDGALIINTKRSIENYYEEKNVYIYNQRFKQYIPDSGKYEGHFAIHVAYNGALSGGTNVARTIYVKMVVPVQNASISPMSFDFWGLVWKRKKLVL